MARRRDRGGLPTPSLTLTRAPNPSFPARAIATPLQATRWAFCTLGETREPEEGGGDAQLAPLADGSFYPASSFRLHGRAPLPFPAYLHVSRNHFNLECAPLTPLHLQPRAHKLASHITMNICC